DRAITSIQLDSSATVIRGAHTLKFGVVGIQHWVNGFSAFPTRGTFDFNGQFTRQIGSSSSASSLADFALGARDTGSRNSLVGTFGMRFWQLAPYFQDSWRATDRLTLNAGIRWGLDAPPHES